MNENQLSRYGAISKLLPVELGPQGRVFFVGSTSSDWFGDFGNLFPVDTYGVPRVHSTITAALANCVASRGDVIMVLPGFSTTITGAAGIALSKAGVTIKGIGTGSLRPTITWTTATTAQMTVTAANVTLDNFILDMTGFDAVAAGISVTAANFNLTNCLVITASASAQATVGILTTAAADRLKITNNQFVGTTDAGTATAIRIVGGNEHIIDSNRFYGAYTTSLGAIENNTTACLRVQVTNNIIENATASSTKAMVFVSTSTGSIANNRMQILSGTAPITGAAMSWVGANYYAATIATAGTLI
jgi:hypothetical protein